MAADLVRAYHGDALISPRQEQTVLSVVVIVGVLTLQNVLRWQERQEEQRVASGLPGRQQRTGAG